MKLLLTSSGITNTSIARSLDELLGKPSAIKVVNDKITVVSENAWKKFN